jgi:hypothetical protein
LLILQTLAGYSDPAQNSSQSDSRRSLDVVIKSQQFILVALQNGPSMRLRKVFPLQACSGKLPLHRLDELIDEVKVRLTGNPFMAPAEVLRAAESFSIVGCPWSAV